MNVQKLKAARILKGYTQTDVAKKLGVSLPTYAQKERGKIDFSIKEVIKLANILDLDIAQIDDIFFEGKLTKCITTPHEGREAG